MRIGINTETEFNLDQACSSLDPHKLYLYRTLESLLAPLSLSFYFLSSLPGASQDWASAIPLAPGWLHRSLHFPCAYCGDGCLRHLKLTWSWILHTVNSWPEQMQCTSTPFITCLCWLRCWVWIWSQFTWSTVHNRPAAWSVHEPVGAANVHQEENLVQFRKHLQSGTVE